MSRRPQRFTDAETTIDWLLEEVGPDIRVAAPLGLGKAATLMNVLYRRARENPAISLQIMTALSLDVPAPSSELERRLMTPIIDRVFGDYPGLDYLRDLRAERLPDNVTVSEFFFQPGAMLGNRQAQRHYRSVNYTHVARELLASGVNVLMQMGAPGPDASRFSLSSNTDVTLDLIPALEAARARGDTLALVAQINDQMPMMTRSALIDAALTDAVFEGPAASFKPFGAPAMPVADADYAIGLRVSTLLADGGTLQIGIGSLSDAIAYCGALRQNHNAEYRALVERMDCSPAERSLIDALGGLAVFDRGLYGCTEMLVDGYLQMYRAGVIKRAVYDDICLQELLDAGRIDNCVRSATLAAVLEAGAIRARLDVADVAWLKRFGIFHERVEWRKDSIDPGDGRAVIAPDLEDATARAAIEERCLGRELRGATLVHGAFFLGPNAFYQRLRELNDVERDLFHMTSVGRINHLYGGEALRRVQRRHARFVNTAIKATIFGAIVSDGLENGQVLSGVGGQYNFVAQAHELADGRSILCVRAVRDSAEGPESNIVARYAHTTIPRHLRDIVVTEYGVADLRGKTDEQVAQAMIEIADARFQDDLRQAAIAAGKLAPSYQVPQRARRNTPETVRALFQPEHGRGLFPAYPYGSDFSEIERTLIAALKHLKRAGPRRMLRLLAGNTALVPRIPGSARPYLALMGLDQPRSWRDSLYARLVSLALINAGAITSRDDGASDAECTH